MKFFKSALVVTSLMCVGLVSCDTESESEDINMDVPAEAITPAPAMMPVPAQSNTAPVESITAPAPVESAVPTASLKINPAHGQPGHDCAVAVGAPLGGASPASTAGQLQAAAPVTTQQAPPNTNGMRAVVNPLGAPTPNIKQIGGIGGGNLNPAHGQPGHDCAVAVGAPLPSR